MLKKAFLIACHSIYAVSTFTVAALFGKNDQGHMSFQNDRNPLSDSFFLKVVPISGQISVLLGDRSIVYLDQMEDGEYITQGAGIITKKGAYRVEVNPSGKHLINADDFTLVVPFGSKCRLRLPDNTCVVMQVGSSLRFSPAFTGTERRVELNGCAYFDIAKGDPRPFIIQTRRLTMKAHTSRFAVEDYLNESNPVVTIDSGADKDTSGNKTIEILEKPSAENGCDNLVRYNLNAGNQLFWKEEYFSFDGQLTIKQAIRMFGAAYRMQVVFEDNVKNGPFGWGKIESDLPLDRILKDLELPDLHFQICLKDSTIVVRGN